MRATVDLLDATNADTGARLNRRAAHQESLVGDYETGAWSVGARSSTSARVLTDPRERPSSSAATASSTCAPPGASCRNGASRPSCSTPSTIASNRCATTRVSAARPGSASATTPAASDRRAADAKIAAHDAAASRPACSASPSLSLAHDGERRRDAARRSRRASIALAAPPQRIVSLLPSLTESVCAIGACARLVGTDRFSNWPASVAALPKLGGLDDVRIEARGRAQARRRPGVAVGARDRSARAARPEGDRARVAQSRRRQAYADACSPA